MLCCSAFPSVHVGWLLLVLFVSVSKRCIAQQRHMVRSLELRATKGNFFVHALHSATFFTQTYDVKWSATVKGRPSLPLWLHLMPSRHKAIAFLYGTPVTPVLQIVIHVIARRADTFERAEQLVTIFFNSDAKFNSSTQQIAELRIKNFDAEDFISSRGELLEKLQSSLKESFRGKGINPYVFDILPAVNAPPERTEFIRPHKFGTIVQVGTQRRFHVNVLNLERGLRANAQYCTRNPLVPLDKYFSPKFQMDWCNFQVKNMTMLHSEEAIQQKQTTYITAAFREVPIEESTSSTTVEPLSTEEEPTSLRARYYFWESFLMFPMLGVCCILLLILLSVIFFGRREGQHWRDYKTPKEQLDEYMSVRESQRHLRELSVQRQLLQMTSDRASSTAPLGIHSFLQPRSSSQNLEQNKALIEPFQRNSRSPVMIDPHANESDGRPPKIDVDVQDVPIGKQTVAEAAKACGSSLHLYRNPFEDEPSEEEEEEESDANEEVPLKHNSER